MREPGRRNELLAAATRFVLGAAKLPGVRSIGLLGSIVTEKRAPKDIDLLVVIADEMDLEPLATLSRRLQGQAQALGRGADVFLADEKGCYLGRTCQWRDCRPGIRMRCRAQLCGGRHYVCDDFQVVRISKRLISEPPVTVWPKTVRRATLPPDVEAALASLEGLRAG